MAYRSHLALFRPKGGEGESERESCPFCLAGSEGAILSRTPAVKLKEKNPPAPL